MRIWQVKLGCVGFQAPTRCCRYGVRFGISGTHVTSVRKSAPNDSLPVVVKPAMLQGPQFTHGMFTAALLTENPGVFKMCPAPGTVERAQRRVLSSATPSGRPKDMRNQCRRRCLQAECECSLTCRHSGSGSSFGHNSVPGVVPRRPDNAAVPQRFLSGSTLGCDSPQRFNSWLRQSCPVEQAR